MSKILRGIPVSDADNNSSRRPGGGYSGGLPPRATSGQDRDVYHENGGFVHVCPFLGMKEVSNQERKGLMAVIWRE